MPRSTWSLGRSVVWRWRSLECMETILAVGDDSADPSPITLWKSVGGVGAPGRIRGTPAIQRVWRVRRCVAPPCGSFERWEDPTCLDASVACSPRWRPRSPPMAPWTWAVLSAWHGTCWTMAPTRWRSEEHTSELQSRENLVCRLLLEKKNKHNKESKVTKKKQTI